MEERNESRNQAISQSKLSDCWVRGCGVLVMYGWMDGVCLNLLACLLGGKGRKWRDGYVCVCVCGGKERMKE